MYILCCVLPSLNRHWRRLVSHVSVLLLVLKNVSPPVASTFMYMNTVLFYREWGVCEGLGTSLRHCTCIYTDPTVCRYSHVHIIGNVKKIYTRRNIPMCTSWYNRYIYCIQCTCKAEECLLACQVISWRSLTTSVRTVFVGVLGESSEGTATP